MADHIDKEIEAIKVVLGALEPLSPQVRASVLQYVTGRLQLSHRTNENFLVPHTTTVVGEPPKPAQIHIKELKEQKKPRYAIEMAALVAYYLQNLAPPEQRKDQISTRDLVTYFKIAEFKLPTKPQFTLPNAKGAGYFDAVGSGEYRLNAVGHNLVAHSLPQGKGEKVTLARKSKTKPTASVPKRK